MFCMFCSSLWKCIDFLHIFVTNFFFISLTSLKGILIERIYRGIGGIPPAAGGAPNRTCFCCCFCISSILALSVSKIIGAKRIMLLVKRIQEAAQEKLYKFTMLLPVKFTTLPVKLRTGSGNWNFKKKNHHFTIQYERREN